MKAIISFKNFDAESPQWYIIKEWIEEQIEEKYTYTPLRYADSVKFEVGDED